MVKQARAGGGIMEPRYTFKKCLGATLVFSALSLGDR